MKQGKCEEGFYVNLFDLTDKRLYPHGKVTRPIIEEMRVLKNMNLAYHEEIVKNVQKYNELKEKLNDEFGIRVVVAKISPKRKLRIEELELLKKTK
jgi:hypothetical protein